MGIYPETKHPTYFDQLGLSLEEPLLATLMAHRFTDPKRVFIQSFEVKNLKDELPQLMARLGINLPLVQLFDQFHQQPYDFVVHGDTRTYHDLISRDSLSHFVATYATAVGVWKHSLVSTTAVDVSDSLNAEIKAEIKGGFDQDTVALPKRSTEEGLPIITDAHAAGLLVHSFTFRDEKHFLIDRYQGNAIAEYQQFYALGVDGVFSDFPDTAITARIAIETKLA